MALAGTGLGASSLDWKPWDGTNRALTWRACSTSPLAKAAIISATSSPAQWLSTEMVPTAPDGEQGQRVTVIAAVDLKAGRGLGEQGRGAGRVAGGVLDPDDDPFGRQAHDHPGRHLASRSAPGCRTAGPAGRRPPPPRPGCGLRFPACDGRL